MPKITHYEMCQYSGEKFSDVPITEEECCCDSVFVTDWTLVPCDKPTCQALTGQHCRTKTGSALPASESHVSRRRNYYAQFPDKIPPFHPLRRNVTTPVSDAREIHTSFKRIKELEAQIDKLRSGVRLSALDRALEHHRRAWFSDERATEQEIAATTEAFEKIILGADSSPSAVAQIRDLLNDSGLWDDDDPMNVSSLDLLRLLTHVRTLVGERA